MLIHLFMVLSFFRCLIILDAMPVFDSQISCYQPCGFCVHFVQLASYNDSGRVGLILQWDWPLVTNIQDWGTPSFSWILSTQGPCPASVTRALALELARGLRAMLLSPAGCS